MVDADIALHIAQFVGGFASMLGRVPWALDLFS